MIKIEFNKQIIDRCDSKIDFRGIDLFVNFREPLKTSVFRGNFENAML